MEVIKSRPAVVLVYGVVLLLLPHKIMVTFGFYPSKRLSHIWLVETDLLWLRSEPTPLELQFPALLLHFHHLHFLHLLQRIHSAPCLR